MIVLPPIALNSTNVTSNAPTTAAPGNDPAAWVDGNYNFGDTVRIDGTTNKIYECIWASGVTIADVSPELDVLKIQPKWLEISPTNKYKMFDNLSDSYTAGTTTLTVTIVPGMTTTALAITHLNNVSNVAISGRNSGLTTVWSKTFVPDLNYPNASTIYFDVLSTVVSYVLVFTGTGTFTIGNVVVSSTYYNIGKLQNGTIIDSLNFSSMDRDTYGNVQLIPRRAIIKTQHKVFIDPSNLETLKTVKDLLNATPAVWSGLDDKSTHPYFNSLVILGFYREFTFEMDNPIGPMANIEIEEV